jgi:hypothetical protein
VNEYLERHKILTRPHILYPQYTVCSLPSQDPDYDSNSSTNADNNRQLKLSEALFPCANSGSTPILVRVKPSEPFSIKNEGARSLQMPDLLT